MKKLSFLFLITVLAGTPVAGKAVAAPTESYKNSCTNISLGREALTATCRDSGGKNVTATLKLPCDGDDIRNNNGKLECVGSQPGPAGSYKKSCKDISTSTTGLKATCRAVNGKWIPAALTLPCNKKDITNKDGRLVCE